MSFLLAANGGANVVGVLEVHRALQEVFAGKARHQPMLVLVYAAVEVVDNAIDAAAPFVQPLPESRVASFMT